MRKLIFCLSLLFSLFTPFVFCLRNEAQDSSDLQDKTIIDLHLSSATLLETLGELAVHHRVPIGFEIAADDDEQPRLTLDINRASLEQVMELIIHQVPKYEWQIRDGVVNIQPKDSSGTFLDRLLNTRISHYTAPKNATKFEIRNAIFDLDEVKRVLAMDKMKISKLDYFTYPSIYSKEVDLSITNTDVRGVLNKVARDSEHKIWVVHLKGENRDSVEIAF